MPPDLIKTAIRCCNMDLLIIATFQTQKINFMRNQVLKNNLKPATHFIEVYKIPTGKLFQGEVYNIDILHMIMNNTAYGCITVAIYKIRLK